MCMRRFHLQRDNDISGISGTGIVCEGVYFVDTGETVLYWRGEHSSINIYKSIEDVLLIHGHEGSTKIIFDDN